MKKIFKTSKWFHKYLGLFLILFLMWMSVSGILMNHPEIIADISVPHWVVPSHYHIKNWNRSSLIGMKFIKQNPSRAFLFGKQGIWETTDSGKSFQSYMEGYPESSFYYKTNDLYLHETDSVKILFAASNGGLFIADISIGKWEKIFFGENDEQIRRILKVNDKLLVFSESNVYQTSFENPIGNYKRVTPKLNKLKSEVTLIDLFFHLHDGRIWGLPGKLLFDLVGIIIFFLCLSAFYTWYFPKMLKRKRNKKKPLSEYTKKNYRLFFKYHLKLGIWSSVIVIIIAGTGFFMRPPLLAVIANGSIGSKYYPGYLSANPWNEKIQNALYDARTDDIVIATSEGLYHGKSNLQFPFRKIELNVPIFVMGATVFVSDSSDGYLVGSFSGLFSYDPIKNNSVDVINGNEVGKISSVKPAEKMITGYFQTPSGAEFVTTHVQGLIPLDINDINARFEMPPKLTANFKMSLWNYLFEIHNGRFFKGLLGGFNILIVPVGAFLFLIITISGVIDWLYIRPKN